MVLIFCRLCTCLDWEKDGDVLAVTQDKNGMCVHVNVPTDFITSQL